MSIFEVRSVTETRLWRCLLDRAHFGQIQASRDLASNVSQLCDEAMDRFKNFSHLHPQFTLHDSVHSLRVCELMYDLIPSDVLPRMNFIEVGMLILAAHFHDLGMVPDSSELQALKVDPDFLLFEQNWQIDHPEMKALQKRIPSVSPGAEFGRLTALYAELQLALLGDYLRITHGDRSAKIVAAFENDTRWGAGSTNLAPYVAKICASHVKPCLDISERNGFRVDEAVGNQIVNVAYLCVLLRLADILDFDRERTPDSLYRSISFNSTVSLMEWEKHRSVRGWIISKEKIQFTMLCTHPEYQRSAYRFMDWIDKELSDSKFLVTKFPGPVSHYRLDLPLQVDRSRIEPKDKAYIYHDLEFSLSRNEIVSLLLTEKLYGSPKLCIRELVQNSSDALRHRKAMFKRDGQIDWIQGRIVLEHGINDQGVEFLTCEDNGAGMDEEIIRNFLTKVGRSFYRSPAFERERAGLLSSGVDFDPCSQFGIGFMSCFMLGDRISIRTRRDLGTHAGAGKSLLVEIDGIGGMIVIREAPSELPVGTHVTIWMRSDRGKLGRWQEPLQLIEVIGRFVEAVEFPVLAKTSSPLPIEQIATSPGCRTPRTRLEDSGLTKIRLFEQPFSALDSDALGCIRAAFLVDDDGKICLKNSEAEWTIPKDPQKPLYIARPDGSLLVKSPDWEGSSTCIDGILVGGKNRLDRERPIYGIPLTGTPTRVPNSKFVLDLRGKIKPPLTPSREPALTLSSGLKDRRWHYADHLVHRANGLIFDQILSDLAEDGPETVWDFLEVYGYWVCEWVKPSTLARALELPMMSPSGILQWKKISQCSDFQVIIDNSLLTTASESDRLTGPWPSGQIPNFYLRDGDGLKLCSPPSRIRWGKKSDGLSMLYQLVIGLCSIVGPDTLRCRDLRDEERPIALQCLPVNRHYERTVFALPYTQGVRGVFSCETPFISVNANNPLVNYILERQYEPNSTSLWNFAEALVSIACVDLVTNSSDLRARYHLGCLYECIEWEHFGNEFKPPYTIVGYHGKHVDLTESLLMSWAQKEVP